MRLEESIQGLEGVKRLTSTSFEGSASLMVEVETGYDTREVLDDVKARVDAISTFPLETEEPIVQELLIRMQVINVSLYGDTDELTLKLLGEQVRDALLTLDGISQADLKSIRPYEIAIRGVRGCLETLWFDFRRCGTGSSTFVNRSSRRFGQLRRRRNSTAHRRASLQWRRLRRPHLTESHRWQPPAPVRTWLL